MSIAKYLELDATERGLVNLPVHYSYGMSIVNSHLWVGATLLLTQRSVVEPEFWKFCRQNGATSFAGVPHNYDLLSRIDFQASIPKTLRYFTQAGGRLAPERVIELDKIAKSNECRFYVMYGQTEAAPRMAWLPPHLITRHAGSIGIAIPGGNLMVQDEHGRDLPPNTEGELVYDGPNVMMGYAFSHHDLREAQGSRQLRTGDLARYTEDGIFYITGRMSRFVKIFGNRIGLDDVERLCLEAGYPAIATGTDEKLLVVTREENHLADITELLRRNLKLPAMSIELRYMQEYPALPTGKMDYAGLKASIAPKEIGKVSGPQTVPEIYKKFLGTAAKDETLSFYDLNGDSLTFVRVSLELEASFGKLPEGWYEMPMVDLQKRLTQTPLPKGDAGSSSGSVLQNIDTLRALACLLVVMYHVFGDNQNVGLEIAIDSPWRALLDLLDLIRMPLFTALAGLLYAAIPTLSGGFREFAKRRFLTLIIPAIAVAVIYYVIQVSIGKDHPPPYPSILYGYLHLWYLYALFEIAILVAAIDLFIRPSSYNWLAIILGLYLLPHLLPWTISTVSPGETDLVPCHVKIRVSEVACRRQNVVANPHLALDAIPWPEG